MTPHRIALRRTSLLCRSLHPKHSSIRQFPRLIGTLRGREPPEGNEGNEREHGRRRGGAGRFLGGMLVALAASGGAVWLYSSLSKPEPKPREATIEYEKVRPQPESEEDNRDIISSQHLQVKKSWENPGVYAWGSNSGRVAAPDSTDNVVKTPRRIPYFDGQLLRDLKLDREFGAAVTEKGDLVQWGVAFSPANPMPALTLKGKDLAKISISQDRIIALSKSGTVYSLPVARADQTSGGKPNEGSWFSFWSSSSSPVSYRQLKPKNLQWNESITDITSGLEHALLLTSKGRVFSAASSTSDFPSKGQLGIPGLTWATRPKGPYDQPHEILALKGFKIAKIAAGDYHSLALDSDGRVFVFGDNSSGQLGFEVEREIPFIATPVPLPFNKIYSGTRLQPRITSVAGGGATSFFTVDATRVAGPREVVDGDTSAIRDLGRVTADVWACGSGIWGSLGTGRWTHVSLGPSKIKALSGLYEWNEDLRAVAPIRLAHLSAGSTHAAAVMDNWTEVSVSPNPNANSSAGVSPNETNYGADIVFWGGNEFYQLGTGKRNNVPVPMYIQPLDGGLGDAEKGRLGEEHRFQITPRTTVRLGEEGRGRRVSVQQRVECGRFVTAVYSGT
ncbi:RCC1/BLIP-II [Whalleya microplaca]|nr:RCC1/BLIP-II [Whalleya microplaca]